MSEPGSQNLQGLSPAVQEQVRAQARRLATELALHPHHSPEFRRVVAAVQAIGAHAQQQAAQGGRAALPATVEPQVLAELRRLVGRLQPARPGLLARLRGRWPTAPTPEEHAQLAAQSAPLLESLYRSQDNLRRQQAALAGELRRLESSQATLEQALALAAELDHLLSASLPDLEARQPLHAAVVRDEALYAVRGRHTDLHTALATTAQARLALDLARQQAAGLDEQLERAAAGVVTALKLARRASQAAALRAQATQASEQLHTAQQQLAAAPGPDELNTALAQAYAALDHLEQLENRATHLERRGLT